MAEQRLLEFRYSPFNGEEIPYDVYRDGERLFSLSEALKRGIVREVFREEETAEFLPGYVRTGYRIVPSSYGKPNPEGASEVSHWKLLPPTELDRILEEKEKLKQELQELEEYGKEPAVAQLYRNVLFDEDVFVFPSYLLELEGRKAGNEEVLERMKDLLGWIPETPQGLAFGLALVGKVYGILPEGLDIENLRDRTFETQKEAGDAVVREVERFQKKIEPLLQSGTEPEL